MDRQAWHEESFRVEVPEKGDRCIDAFARILTWYDGISGFLIVERHFGTQEGYEEHVNGFPGIHVEDGAVEETEAIRAATRSQANRLSVQHADRWRTRVENWAKERMRGFRDPDAATHSP